MGAGWPLRAADLERRRRLGAPRLNRTEPHRPAPDRDHRWV